MEPFKTLMCVLLLLLGSPSCPGEVRRGPRESAEDDSAETSDAPPTVQPTVKKEFHDDLLTILDAGQKELNLLKRDDYIVVLGLTGSGKSTLIQFLTGISLVAVRKNNVLLFEDESRKISRIEDSSKSKTLFPELVVDLETGQKLVDCPGYHDTRKRDDPTFDIATTYFVQKVFDAAKRVKIIFTIPHIAVDGRGSSRGMFYELLKYATVVIKDVEKYRRSIGLVITKVPNIGPSENQATAAVKYMKGELKSMEEDAKYSTGKDKKQLEEMGAIIKTLTKFDKSTKQYFRIGLFHQPDQVGPVNNSTNMRTNKEELRELVLSDDLPFVDTEKGDFGYYLSDKSKIQIQNRIARNVTDKIAESLKFVKDEVVTDIRATFNSSEDIEVLKTYLKETEGMFSTYNNVNITKEEVFKLLLKQLTRKSHANITAPIIKSLGLMIQLNFLTGFYDTKMNYFERFGLAAFQEIPESIQDIRAWIEFIQTVKILASTFTIQKFKQKYNRADVQNWGETRAQGEESKIEITTENIKQFVSKIVTSEETIIRLLKLEANKFVLKSLNDVLRVSFETRTACSKDKRHLTVHGVYLVSSELFSIHCNGTKKVKLETIRWFASHTVYIDSNVDFTGREIQLTIIAPTWQVMGKHRIILDGAKGVESPKARVDKSGNPGRPGQPSGKFFGIAQDIVEGGNLEIRASGGDGGAGQEGGDGSNGIDGTTPLMTKCEHESLYLGESRIPNEDLLPHGYKNFDYCSFVASKLTFGIMSYRVIKYRNGKHTSTERDDKYCGRIPMTYTREHGVFEKTPVKIYGDEGTAGRKAGDGGRGGFGAQGVSPQLVSTGNTSQVRTYQNTGKDGRGGSGGKGGRGGQGRGTLNLFHLYNSTGNSNYELAYKTRDDTHTDGQDGVPNNNTLGIKTPSKPRSVKINIIASFRDYKTLMRGNHLFEKLSSTYFQFLRDVTKTEGMAQLYDLAAICEDLTQLEIQRRTNGNYPDYQTHQRLILEYLDHNRPRFEDKPLFRVVYTAVLSSMRRFNSYSDRFVITDLHNYIKHAITLVESHNQNRKEQIIQQINENYRKSIDAKITEAENLISDQVSGEITNTLKDLSNNERVLHDETLGLIKEAKDHKIELEHKMQQVKRNMNYRVLFGTLSFISTGLSLLGPAGAAAGTLISLGSRIGESQAITDVNVDNVKFAIPPGVTMSWDSINQQETKDVKALLEVAEMQLAKFPELFNELSSQIATWKSNIEENKNNPQADVIGLVRTKIVSAFKTMKEYLQTPPVGTEATPEVEIFQEAKVQKALAVLSTIQIAASLGEVATRYVAQQGEDQSKLNSLETAVNETDDSLKHLISFKENVHKILQPILMNVHSKMQEFSQENSRSKSSSLLEYLKWEVRKALAAVKTELGKLLAGFQVESKYLSCISQLEEVANLQIAVYDNIQKYEELKQFGDYVAALSYGSVTSNVTKTQEAIKKLNFIIESNVLWIMTNQILSSFKQQIFPFARMFSDDSFTKLEASDLTFENSTTNVIAVLKETESSMNKIQTTVHSPFHQYRTQAVFTNNSVGPFYTWTDETHETEIENLFSGKEVYFVANIFDAGVRNAIKFKILELVIRAKDRSKQPEFDKVLKHFDAHLTHLGSSHYRCDDQVFTVTSDKVSIHHSFEKTASGFPVRTNEVYKQLSKGDYILSPFTVWKFQLVQGRADPKFTFALLDALRGRVELSCEGEGQYLHRNAAGVCDTALSQHYDVYDGSVASPYNFNREEVENIIAQNNPY